MPYTPGAKIVKSFDPRALPDDVEVAERDGHIRKIGTANGKPIYKIVTPQGEVGHVAGIGVG